MPPDTDLEHGGLPRLGIAALIAVLLATAATAVIANRLLVHDRSTADHQRAAATTARVQAAVRRAAGSTRSLVMILGDDPASFGRDVAATVRLADQQAQAVLVAAVTPAKRSAFASAHPELDLSGLTSRLGPSGESLLFPSLVISGTGPLPGSAGADAAADPALQQALLANATQFGLVVEPHQAGPGTPGVWFAQATSRPPDADSAAGYAAVFFPASDLLGADLDHATLRVEDRPIDPSAAPRKPIGRSFSLAGDRWTVLVARRPLSLGAKLAPAIIAVFGLILAFLIWLSLGGVIREHRDEMSLERRRSERRVLAERAAEEERRRIARELHDSISQALFSMSLQVRTASVALEREGIDTRSPLARAIGELGRLTRGALAEIRALIFELRPEGLREEGLVAALRKHAAAVAARDGVPLEVDLPEEPLPLDPGVEEELYRVAQEAIHNAVRHSDATKVVLSGGLDPERGIWLEIVDDGRGFELNVDRPGHLGLRTMAERAARAGGDLSSESSPGAGTRVRLSLPLVAAGAGR